MPDHDEGVEREAARTGVGGGRAEDDVRRVGRATRSVSAAEGLLVLAGAGVVLVVVGLATRGAGWTVAGGALLVVLVGGLIALRLARRR